MHTAVTCFKQVVSGLPTTISLTIVSILLAMFLGILLSIGMNCRIKIVFKILSSFLKGIPILVFLYLFNSSIDEIMGGLSTIFGFVYDIRRPPTYTFAVIAMGLSYAPYMADMIMTAMQTIPKGQWEACAAGGFTKGQALFRIIIPQCIVIALPNFGNHFVNLLKATSLACMVTIMEMMGEARNFATMSQKFLNAYIVCALVYWLVFVAFEQVFRSLEKSTGRYLNPVAIPTTSKKKRHSLFKLEVEPTVKEVR